jgi:peptidoglycan/xylan/chitin deacetylase (PgdA/CDA1 family)
MRGALVISLDFEIHWGVLERPLDGPYRQNLLGVPASVRGALALFREMEIHATWAVVGLLCARSREEALRFAPAVRPRYPRRVPDPFRVPTGQGEHDDPFHYAPTLVREVAATPGQELGTHTYAHLYCGERADNRYDAFRADLRSARAIMRETLGVEPRSVVFPRNQHDVALEEVLVQEGMPCFRGNPRGWMWAPRCRGPGRLAARALRLADLYLPAGRSYTTPWRDVPQPSGAFNVPASFFLRPGLPAVTARRIARAIRVAAERGEIVHLWWHPHNYGVRTAQNLATVRSLLEVFDACRAARGMESLSMGEVASRCGCAATGCRAG